MTGAAGWWKPAGRQSKYETDTYQLQVSLNGDAWNWQWELYGGYGENNSDQYNSGYFNLDRVGDAVGATHFDDAGTLQCGASPDDAIAGCVPLNIFGLPGTEQQVTNEMLKYVSEDYNSFTLGKNQLKSVTFAASRSDLFNLPAGPLGLAFGLEKHWYDGAQTVDTQQLLGASTAGVAQNTGGGYDVEEAFLEVNIPLLSDIPGFDYLEINLATRYSDYSTYGDTLNSKFSFRWSVIDSLTFRGTMGESFRAPSIPELYEGQFRTFPNATDPCTTDANANCIANGVPPGGYNDGITQIPSDQGGNPDLDEETAETITFGFVYEPNWWDMASLTVDYWDIDIENPITNVGTQTRLDGCHGTGAYCDSISRFGPETSVWGTIITVEDLKSNAGRIETSGVDLAFRTQFPQTNFGTFGMGLDWAYLIEYDKTEADGSVKSHAGAFYDDNGNDFGDGLFARNRGILTFNWMLNDWSATWRTNYTSGVTEDLTPLFWHSETERAISSMTTHDIQFQYNFSNWHTRLSLGVDNLTDEEPPFVDSAFANNTDHTYQMIGTFYYGRITFTF